MVHNRAQIYRVLLNIWTTEAGPRITHISQPRKSSESLANVERCGRRTVLSTSSSSWAVSCWCWCLCAWINDQISARLRTVLYTHYRVTRRYFTPCIYQHETAGYMAAMIDTICEVCLCAFCVLRAVSYKHRNKAAREETFWRRPTSVSSRLCLQVTDQREVFVILRTCSTTVHTCSGSEPFHRPMSYILAILAHEYVVLFLAEYLFARIYIYI